VENIAAKLPSKKLNCPAKGTDDIHHLKMKELIKLKLEENEYKEYICGICKKTLAH